mgnify:CR=1 FL=1
MFHEIMTNQKLSIQEVSAGSGVPRSTIADLISGKTAIDRMSAGNLYKLSSFFQLPMQDFYIYCQLPEIKDVRLFIVQENERIIENGLKIYVQKLTATHLVETSFALNDRVRFEKYASAVRDFYKYRRLPLPDHYAEYMSHLTS